jgi:hypothetical protein
MIGGGRTALSAGYRGEQDEARRGLSRHANEHSHTSIDVLVLGPIAGGGTAQRAGYRGEQDEARRGPSLYANKYSQPSINV